MQSQEEEISKEKAKELKEKAATLKGKIALGKTNDLLASETAVWEQELQTINEQLTPAPAAVPNPSADYAYAATKLSAEANRYKAEKAKCDKQKEGYQAQIDALRAQCAAVDQNLQELEASHDKLVTYYRQIQTAAEKAGATNTTSVVETTSQPQLPQGMKDLPLLKGDLLSAVKAESMPLNLSEMLTSMTNYMVQLVEQNAKQQQEVKGQDPLQSTPAPPPAATTASGSEQKMDQSETAKRSAEAAGLGQEQSEEQPSEQPPATKAKS